MHFFIRIATGNWTYDVLKRPADVTKFLKARGDAHEWIIRIDSNDNAERMWLRKKTPKLIGREMYGSDWLKSDIDTECRELMKRYTDHKSYRQRRILDALDKPKAPQELDDDAYDKAVDDDSTILIRTE